MPTLSSFLLLTWRFLFFWRVTIGEFQVITAKKMSKKHNFLLVDMTTTNLGYRRRHKNIVSIGKCWKINFNHRIYSYLLELNDSPVKSYLFFLGFTSGPKSKKNYWLNYIHISNILGCNLFVWSLKVVGDVLAIFLRSEQEMGS